MHIVMNLLGGGPAPAVSFCTAVPWWIWCRVGKNPPKLIGRVPK